MQNCGWNSRSWFIPLWLVVPLSSWNIVRHNGRFFLAPSTYDGGSFRFLLVQRCGTEMGTTSSAITGILCWGVLGSERSPDDRSTSTAPKRRCSGFVSRTYRSSGHRPSPQDTHAPDSL